MVARETAVAHPMEALVKYHGLKDWDLRIPYHDSISVNLEALWTRTTVEFGDFEGDSITINGQQKGGRVLERALGVVDKIRSMAQLEDKVKIDSTNNLPFEGVKGLGYSSSAGAALAAASFKAAKLDSEYGWDLKIISRIARRLAGSACRSVVGGYARWYAGDDDESSFAENIASRRDLDMRVVVVPLQANFSTEEAHREVTHSNFFDARITSASRRCDEMQRAIRDGNLESVGALAELDSLELHALTMTGEKMMILFRPESLRVIEAVRGMRERGMKAYFSTQTGPSVFINSFPEDQDEILSEIGRLGLVGIESAVGDEVTVGRT